MLHVYYYEFPDPIGRLGIAADETGITHIFPDSKCPVQNTVVIESSYIKEASLQLQEYFDGMRTEFNLPLSPSGTAFQKKVWNALLDIPYGETCSYKDIALKIQSPKGFQAIGQANANNPLPFVIPCHRVIAADGSLGGYALGLRLKAWLLELEQRNH